ncbi:MAG: glycosyltransferase [Frankiales bacterium]|nr:glycosyltransferase [Frankiales bacterium]
MKVLHVLNEFGRLGNGIVNVALDLACGQSDRGHAVAVASGGGSFVELAQRHGVEHFDLDQRRTAPQLAVASLAFRRLVQQFQPDVVHAHMMTGAVLGWGLRSGFRYGLVTTVHNEYQRSALLMGLGDRVVGVSEAVAEAMAARHVPRRRLRVVRNGTIGSPRRLPPEAQPVVALQRPAVVSIGAVSPRKGSDLLVDAFLSLAEEHPAAHLYLVGNVDWPELQERTRHRPHADRVHFSGFSPDPRAYLDQADVFVLASRREPFGLVLSEAREAGVAVVATDVDGIPEALDSGRAGLLVPPEDSRALARALGGLLGDPTERAAAARRAASGLEALTVARMLDGYEAVYSELLQGRDRA